ncbi:hypothetical protein R9X47_29225 [Wukongibacter baidiensis]|uniref:hypothetical protein n=1 Tax=Wukongibacter baidiensis TaxID=1723361 RepID=UPI003D7FE304
MYKENLWNLFLTTGDLSFYLELRKMEAEGSGFSEQSEEAEIGGTQNISLR